MAQGLAFSGRGWSIFHFLVGGGIELLSRVWCYVWERPPLIEDDDWIYISRLGVGPDDEMVEQVVWWSWMWARTSIVVDGWLLD